GRFGAVQLAFIDMPFVIQLRQLVMKAFIDELLVQTGLKHAATTENRFFLVFHYSTLFSIVLLSHDERGVPNMNKKAWLLPTIALAVLLSSAIGHHAASEPTGPTTFKTRDLIMLEQMKAELEAEGKEF